MKKFFLGLACAIFITQPVKAFDYKNPTEWFLAGSLVMATRSACVYLSDPVCTEHINCTKCAMVAHEFNMYSAAYLATLFGACALLSWAVRKNSSQKGISQSLANSSVE